jgi:hypothetical protein
MRNLLLLSLLLIFISPSQEKVVSDNGSLVVVLGSKWTKSRHKIKNPETAATVAPAAAMTAADKNFERNRRINDPAGARDPNADTLDARSAALEKIVQESRSPKEKIVDGFSYRAKIQNASNKVVEIVFWEYQFKEKANPERVGRRQFLCAVNIKPDKEKELLGFSLSGPSNVISVDSLANKSGNLFDEKVVINRVEYADGSIWQRRDWNFAEIKATFQRAVGTPWGAEMCRAL